MTPGEIYDTGREARRLEQARDRTTWEKFAYLATWIANSSGMRRRPVTFHQAMPKFKSDEPVDLEKRRREAMETLKFHKSKCWMLLRGPSPDDVHIFDDDDYTEYMKKKRGGEN